MGFFSKKRAVVQVGLPQVPLPLPNATRYYRNPIYDDQAAGPGLRIEIPPGGGGGAFHEATVDTLDAIYNTPTGKILIDTLVDSGRSVKIIQTATRGNSCDVGPSGLSSVASELATEIAFIRVKSRQALDRAWALSGDHGGNKYFWLARAINGMPFYQLKGEPPTVGKQIGIAEGDVRSWFEGTTDFEADRLIADKQHIANSIIVALQPGAVNGVGSDAAITFNADPNFVMNLERPAGIGLAHELIHAYWSVKGQQVGHTIDHGTTVLFEHQCVGLGAWDNRLLAGRVCENQIRSEWFGNTASLFELSDRVNRSSPSRRGFYSPP